MQVGNQWFGDSPRVSDLDSLLESAVSVAIMATSVSIWRVSLMAWAVVAAVKIHTALCDPSASWDPNIAWNLLAIACGCE